MDFLHEFNVINRCRFSYVESLENRLEKMEKLLQRVRLFGRYTL